MYCILVPCGPVHPVDGRSGNVDRNNPRARRLALAMAALLGAGIGTAPAADRLAVLGAIASADDGNVPANTLDGSLATRWSASGDGQWIRFDMGTARTVGSVRIAWHKGDQRRNR